MTSDTSSIELFFIIASIVLPFAAILFKMGKMKPVFLPLPTNVEIPVDWPYACWPLGLGSLLVYLGLVTDNRSLALIGLFGIIPSSFILMAWKPHWLKPDWLQWLEEHYDEPTREFMFEQARKEGRAWSRRVATQAGLEVWAKEMAQRYDSLTGRPHW